MRSRYQVTKNNTESIFLLLTTIDISREVGFFYGMMMGIYN